ncbi:hypothetical protein VPFG_00259 [Vibrio phage nt-1]|uniref:Uncharacterized protein n=1 Tax=Vibrio phage nt-1 TaxID=115992 RepID=R9TGM8_9CAUD|nr:hypothetical protein VPFG_00259 [Vibrio phage nt-1]AGN30258.1 hypothetical protein VPFG_00259 [Vibrio phage nt-1]
MHKMTVHVCDYCDFQSILEREVAAHEKVCAAVKTFNDVKAIQQAQAHAYLDTIRLRACSFKHLFDIILDEEDMIIEAVHVLHYYGEERKTPRMMNFRWEFCHFCHEYQQFRDERKTHSAPVGEKTCPMWSENREDIKFGLASSIRCHWEHQGNRKKFDLYRKYIGRIPGINCGTGGGVEKCDSYLTLWKDDFPLIRG